MYRLVRCLLVVLWISAVGPGTLNVSAAAPGLTYLVVYKLASVPTDAAASLARAGGKLVQNHDAIGVVVATSSNPRFRDDALLDSRIQDVQSTAGAGVRLKDPEPDPGAQSAIASISIGVTAADTSPTDLTSLQWNMRQIDAFNAHRVTRGSRSALVGDIDTGVDFRHPDLKANIDFANSVSCVGDTPDTTPSAWDDHVGHGTHTAGLIAAADNDLGIVGVAPNVRIAAIKAGDDHGFFYPQAVVCAFMWAATHHINITNNSYFSDPFYFNCPSDAEQNAILTAEQRAVRFAQSRGVLVVASMDNFRDDLANPTMDSSSPTDGPPPHPVRPVDRTCSVLPLELPGVIGVGSIGVLGLKSATSNYGLGITDVVAPGGDGALQITPDAPNGRILSTWPASLIGVCTRRILVPTTDADEPQAAYCYQQGTSMAAPHVAGVAALVLSRVFGGSSTTGNRGQVGSSSMSGGIVDSIACPSPEQLAAYAAFPSVNNGAPQVCTGADGYNSWYGFGLIDAFKAVTIGGRVD